MAGKGGSFVTSRIKWNIDPVAALQGYADLATSFEAAAAEEVQSVHDDYTTYLLNELRYYPPKTYSWGNPPDWTSEAQRRAYRATGGFGRGIPTERTYALRDGWSTQFRSEGVESQIIVQNTARANPLLSGVDENLAQYAVGTFNQTNALARRQRFHGNAGWPTANEQVNYWFNLMLYEAIRRIYARLGEDVATVRGKRTNR